MKQVPDALLTITARDFHDLLERRNLKTYLGRLMQFSQIAIADPAFIKASVLDDRCRDDFTPLQATEGPELDLNCNHRLLPDLAQRGTSASPALRLCIRSPSIIVIEERS